MNISPESLPGHDIVKVFLRDFLRVARCSLQHLKQLLMTHSLSQLLGNPLDVVDVDSPVAFVVEQLEDLADAVLS